MSPRTRRRRLALALALALAGLALLGAGLFPQEPLRRFVEARLRAALGPDLRLRRLHLVPVLLRADIEGLELRNAQVEAFIPRGRLQLSLGTLLGRELVVEALEIESPRLVLRPSGGGPPTVPPALFVLRRVAVRDAQLAIETGAGRAELAGLDVTGALGVGRLDLRARSGAWHPIEGPPLALRRAHASLTTAATLEARLEALELETAGSRLRAQGALGRLSSPRLALDVDGRVLLPEVQELAGATGLAGTIDLHGRVEGPAAALDHRWTVTGRDLALAAWPIEELTLELARPGRATAWTAGGRARLLEGELSLEATTDGRTADAHVAADLDSERLRRQLGVGSAPLPGRLSARLSLRGPLDGRMNADLRATAHVVTAGQSLHLEGEGSGLVSRARGADLDLTLRAEGTSTSPAHRLAGWAVSAQGHLRGSRIEGDFGGAARVRNAAGAEPTGLPVNGRFLATGPDWSASLEAWPAGGRMIATAQAHASTFGALAIEVRDVPAEMLSGGVHGRVDLDFRGAGPAARLDGELTARARDLATGAARIGSVSLSGPVRQGRADLEVRAADLALAGRLRLDAEQAQGQLDAVELPLERVAGDAVTGTLEASLDFTVPLAYSDRALAQAQVRSLALAREAWSLSSREPFAVRLEAGQVTLERTRLAGTGLDLGLQGTLDLRTEAIRGGVEVAADLAALALPAEIERRGRVSGRLELAGTLDRPAADGALAWQGLELDGATTPRLVLADGSVVLTGRAVEIAGIEGQWAGGALHLSGRVPGAAVLPGWRREPPALAADEGATLRLEWRELDIEQLRAAVAPAPGDDAPATDLPTGHLAGSLAVEGGLAAWGEARAHLVAPATELSLADTSLRLSPLDLRLRAGIVRGEPIALDTANGKLVLAGEADLARRRADLALVGQVELRALSALLSQAALTGHATVDLRAQGPFDSLRPQGSVLVRDAGLRLRLLPQAITALQAELTLDEDGWLRLPQAQAEMGGGPLLLGGQARIGGFALQDIAFALSARNAALSYPPGLRSRIDADLRLTGRSGALLLAGKVATQRGRYDLDQALAASAATGSGPSPLLRSVDLRLDLGVDQPLRVTSQLYQFEQVTARGRLELRGNLETPLPYGRLDLARDGVMRLQGQELRLEHGLLTYRGAWDATLDVQARAQVAPRPGDEAACGLRSGESVELTARVSGTLGLPDLSAQGPAHLEGDALSFLVTGRCDTQLSAAGGDLFLADRLTRGLAGLRQLGIDEVSIQPQLLARETDPGARFTFGKRLGRVGRVIYSTRLNLPEDQWVKLDVGPWRTLAGTVERREGGEWRATAGQRLEFGGAAAAGGARRRRSARPALGAVVFEGALPYPEQRLRGVLDLKPGQRAGSWTVLERADALRDWLQAQGHLEAEVDARLDGATARVRVDAGARYGWRVSGARLPEGFSGLLRSGLFVEESLDLGRARIERDLRRDGHLQAHVSARVEEAEGQRVLVFEAQPGPASRLVGAELRGARALSQKHLLARAGGVRAAAAELAQARRAWLAAYHERHHLAARVEGPRLAPVAGGVRLEATIDEGPVARIAALEFPGATLESTRLASVAGLQAGDPVDDATLAQAAAHVRNHYLGLGYSEARVSLRTERLGNDLAVRFAVEEGPQARLRRLEVEGLEHTRASVILSRAGLALGEPLDPREILAAEQRVQSLGAFASVSSETDAGSGVVRLRLREAPRFLARYELSWEEQRGVGGHLDGELRHLLGRGLVLGGRYERFRDVEDGRAFLNLPFRRGLLLLSASRLEEQLETPLLTTTRVQRELRVQQTLEPTRWWKLLAGYRFKHVTVEPIFAPVDIAALEPAVLRDSRDNPLDPREGRLYSLGLTLAEAWLASDFRYAKGLGQVGLYRTRGAFTWAQSYRLGLGWGFGGQSIVSSERFKAGGAGSLRGFGTDSLGPVDVIGEARGGEAVLLFNQELRYRHPSGLGAVVFYDGGNVFDRAADLSLDLRHSVGVGLRYASPVGLLRVDLGLPLFRREGEQSYRIFFSLGQAF